MKEEENVASRAPVLFVQFLNSLLAGAAAARLPASFFRSVSKIRQQAEIEVVVPIRQNRTSIASTSSSTCGALRSIAGTTARVRDSFGIPPEKSMRGSRCGVANKVASQFTTATERWLAHSATRRRAAPDASPASRRRAPGAQRSRQSSPSSAASRLDTHRKEAAGERDESAPSARAAAILRRSGRSRHVSRLLRQPDRFMRHLALG